ncbi:MAG: hypothetical protein ACLFPF_06725 [Halanaerobiales bacterium]
MDINKRYSLLTEICILMNRRDYNLSKIKLQQLSYIFQELYSDYSFYDFKLFTYGPYSVELISDLDILCNNGYLIIEYSQGPECFGSKIDLGIKYKLLIEQYKDYWKETEKQLSRVIDLFGNIETRYLELRGTIIYMNRKMGLKDIKKITEEINYIKPYFKDKEIEDAFNDLHGLLDLV